MPTRREERTVSPWVMIAVFAVLTVAGIVTFIGGSSGPVEQLDVAQTVPSRSAQQQADDPNSEPDHREQPDGEPDGTRSGTDDPDAESVALPEGVAEHTDADGVASFTFDPPGDFDTSAGFAVEIAPATARLEGSSVVVDLQCGFSDDEFLAQVFIDKASNHILVTPLVAVPNTGTPCSESSPRSVSLPLGEPGGSRTVSVVPMGTPMPDLQPG